MSMPAPASPADGPAEVPPWRERQIANALAWREPDSWDGDNYVGPGLPPWGTKPRCPVIRNQRRCRKACIAGGTVCNTHGGAAPQVKRRAKLRVLQLLDPALGQLARIIANPDDQRVALQAIKLVADMNGMLQTKTDVDAGIAKAVLMERHAVLRQQVDSERAERGLPSLAELEAPIDAEVIEDPEEDVTAVAHAPLPPEEYGDVDLDTSDLQTTQPTTEGSTP